MLLSLASCAVTYSTTTAEPSVPPPTTTEPPAPPPPEPLSESEQIDLLASLLASASDEMVLSLDGTVRLAYSDGSVQDLSVSGSFASSDSVGASIRFVGDGANALGGELYLKDRVLWLLREEKDGAPTLTRLQELAPYETLLEKSMQTVEKLAELREVLAAHTLELDALFGITGEKLSSADLLSLVSLFGQACVKGLDSIGVETAESFDADVSVRGAAEALYYLCTEYDGEKELLTLTPTRVLSLVSSLYAELEARLDRTVTSILDEYLGEGQTAELYRRLASFTGEDLLSAWRAEVENILVSEGISLDLFYGLLASMLDRSMTAEMTAERLLKLLDENAKKPLDEVIGRFWSGKTYSGFLRDLHSILSMPPTSIYTAFGGVGALSDRLREMKGELDRYTDSLELSLVVDLDGGELHSVSLSLSFGTLASVSADGEPSCVGIALSLAIAESEHLPSPSDRLAAHPDFLID